MNSPSSSARPVLSPSTHGGRDTGRHRGLALVTLCLAVLVAQVDMAVVNLGTRPIGEYFSASVIALQWVVDSYNLVYAVLLLTGGLLADLYGRRRIFMTGAAVFTGATLLCALSTSVWMLIAGRALAGLGAALLMPASLAIIRVVWQDSAERGRALGIWAACNGLAMAIGAPLGGLLIHHFGWRSIFLAVIPLSGAALLLVLRSIPESSDPKGRSLDMPAQVFGALALGGLAFAAIQSHDAPALAAAVLATAVVAFVLFLRIEHGKGAAALVPLDLFSIRAFRSAMVATIGMTFGMYGTLFLVPLTWLGTGTLDATQAGLALIPMSLVFVAVSPFSGRLTTRFGARTTTCGGVAVIGCGLVLIGSGAPIASIVLAEAGLLLAGIGMGFATGPLMGVAVGAVDAARSGTASALINVARIAGATLGVAMLGALYALVHGGADGLRLAMFAGAAVQLACAALAWRMTRTQPA
ncbi:MFS transporter [Variovorax sp. EL159]|uniref:MFS transporter n=1 Tax=Variovorax sp. EL159 TaxID=1566270 RepID=UPI000884DA39|nr:drug resistance transporter, EmrB/QacA subfamily [Variovorax sp. EL159]